MCLTLPIFVFYIHHKEFFENDMKDFEARGIKGQTCVQVAGKRKYRLYYDTIVCFFVFPLFFLVLLIVFLLDEEKCINVLLLSVLFCF